jgi:hypothetical protein
MSMIGEFVLQDTGSITFSSLIRSDYRSYAARTIVEMVIFSNASTDIYMGNYTRPYPVWLDYEIWLHGPNNRTTSDELSQTKARISYYGLRLGRRIRR